jgi:hypothetical protein
VKTASSHRYNVGDRPFTGFLQYIQLIDENGAFPTVCPGLARCGKFFRNFLDCRNEIAVEADSNYVFFSQPRIAMWSTASGIDSVLDQLSIQA